MKMFCTVALVLTTALAVGAGPVWETQFSGDRNVLLRDGVELSFGECVRQELRRHPSAQSEDVLKFCFQAACGPGHILGRVDAARRHFDREFAAVAARYGVTVGQLRSWNSLTQDDALAAGQRFILYPSMPCGKQTDPDVFCLF